jgi:hypothetical protein
VKWRFEVEEDLDFVLEDFFTGLPPICGIL